MKLLISIMLFAPGVCFANSKCYKDPEIKGRNAMVQKFIHGPSNEASKLFEQFCKENASKVTCLTKTVPAADEKKTTTEMMAGKSCGELSPIKNSDNTVTLYFFDSKVK